MAVPVSYYFLYFEQIGVLYMFYWLSYTKHMFINKVTMNIMINLIQMLLIFVFEIRPRDRLQNDSDAMTVFKIISLFPRDQWSELFNVGGFPTVTTGTCIHNHITCDYCSIPSHEFTIIRIQENEDFYNFYYSFFNNFAARIKIENIIVSDICL